MEKMEYMATWLKNHGFPDIRTVKTGQAGALRLHVPKLYLYSEFPEEDSEHIDACFEAIQSLTQVANFCELASELNVSKRK